MVEEISTYLTIVKDALNNWSVERLENKEFFKDCKEELVQVTLILSKLLPKVDDPILFEIDDILYPGQYYQGNENNEYASESKKLNDITNISAYLTAYSFMLDEENIFLDNTVLTFLKHIKCDLDGLFPTIMNLLCSGNARKVCIGLRMYKIVLERGHYDDEEHYSRLSILKEITEAKELYKKKMSNFISKLAGECCELIRDEYVFPKKGLSVEEIIIERIFYALLDGRFLSCYVDFFCKTFVKLETEVERRKYLEYILRGITSYPYGNSLQFAIPTIINSALYNINACNSNSANKELRLIDAKYGRDFKCLDEIDVTIDSKKVWSDEVNANEEEETDYTFEKFFFYDEIMMNLHLLVMLYNACAECNKLCEGEFAEKDYTGIFREENYLMEYISFFLNNPNLAFPWHIEKTMQMCPFLLFPLEHKDLVVDLINYMRGDKVSNMSEVLREKIEEMKAFESLLNEIRQEDLSSYEKR